MRVYDLSILQEDQGADIAYGVNPEEDLNDVVERSPTVVEVLADLVCVGHAVRA